MDDEAAGAPKIDPIPINPRPGSRTFSVCTGPYEISRLARVGLDLLEVLDGELDDYRAGQREAAGLGLDADAYAAGEDDRAVWEGSRILAVIRPRAGGEPEVFRFDEGQPRPATDRELQAWQIVAELGAYEAIARLTRPDLPMPPPPKPLTDAEDLALSAVRVIGEREATDRLLMAGPYSIIREVVDRLGSDAIGELRKMAAAGLDRGSEA